MRTMIQTCATTIIAASLLCCTAGCGGGGGGGGDLGEAIGLDSAEYVLLDLSTGDIETRNSVDDLTTNATYKSSILVFRNVAGGTTTLGQAENTTGYQGGDEVETTATVSDLFVATFELTQDQWTTIANTTPWTDVAGTSVTGNITASGDQPAYNLDQTTIEAALSSYSSGRNFSLVLPSNDQWEYCCRGGATTIYAWSDVTTTTTVTDFAVVRETDIAEPGPDGVAGKQANGFNLHDMHGNIWEWTSDGQLRGGSWKDSVIQARAANKLDLDASTAHVLAGCRLVLVPQ